MKNQIRVINVSSIECYKKNNRPVINNISFALDASDCLGVLSTRKDESKILLELLANLRKLSHGAIIFNNQITSKLKYSLPSIFYVDSSLALIDDMNVLEYIMYITSKSKTPVATRQRILFDMLIEFGLKDFSLSKISILTREERIILTLFTTLFSKSKYIFFNLNQFNFDLKTIDIIKLISLKLRKTRTLIIATNQPQLVGVCSNKILYIYHGQQRFFGTTIELQKKYDDVIFILRDKNTDELFAKCKALFPMQNIRKSGSMVLICAKNGKYLTNSQFYSTLAGASFSPAETKVNLGRISNAIEALIDDDLHH